MSQTTTTKREKEIDTYPDFDQAVMDIHANIGEHDDPVIEVSAKLFLALCKGRKTPYLTYGSPGIKIFQVGTRDGILAEEKLPADQYRDLEIKRKMEARK